MTFDHLAISVESVSDSLAFYRARFPQLTVLHEDPTWAFIEVDSIRIAFVLEDQHPPHMAFRVESRDRLEEMARQDGAPISRHRDGSESYYVDDPAGNAIEFVFYPPQ